MTESTAAGPSVSDRARPLTNLADAVRRSAARTPNSPALVVPGRGDGEVITWAELDTQVDAVAAALTRLDRQDGLGQPAASGEPGPRVAIGLSNVPEFAVALFATIRAGHVAVPLNPGYTSRELRHQLADSGASVIIANADVLAGVAEVRSELPALRHAFLVGGAPGPLPDEAGVRPYLDLVTAVPAPASSETDRSSTGGEDLAVLLYTSGTSGVPKGAMLSHRALIANHRQVDALDPPVIRPDDVVLLALPLFHAFGLNSGLGAIAWHGACGVLVDRFDPAESLDLVARLRVTVIAGVPQMYAAWAAQPELGGRMSSVRVAVSGAAPIDLAAARRFREAIGLSLANGYGLTETAPVVATVLASPVPKVGSIGRPIPEVEVKLVDADGLEIARIGPSGILAGPADDVDEDTDSMPGTDPGEIIVRGPNLFSGYWPDGADGPDSDGWWATGDVAYADEDGDLFLVDRLGELIIVSGFNVYPHEVELVLAGCPGVTEAAVVGIASPQTGQAVKAFVVLDEGATPSTTDLAGHCRRNLARFKCPVEFEFVAHLPYSATGKVRKGSLRGAS